jgi:hypothetical protein
LSEEDKAALLRRSVDEDDDEEDIFASHKGKRLDEDDLFGGLDDPVLASK